jgi:hypothetical protein
VDVVTIRTRMQANRCFTSNSTAGFWIDAV